MEPYWDPVGVMHELLAFPPVGHSAPWAATPRSSSDVFNRGSWDQRDWRNVPGPFYAGTTDTCGGGRFVAPNLILVNEDWTEFIFRQPSSPRELVQLIDAAWDDPFEEYAHDGDAHWTLSEIRTWWRNRDSVLAWIETVIPQMSAEGAVGEVASLHEYAADLSGPLEGRLRRYAYWTENRVAANSTQALPEL